MSREQPLPSRTGEADHLHVDALGVTVRIDLDGVPPADRVSIGEAWSGARHDEATLAAAIVSPRPRFLSDETMSDLSTQVTLSALSARRGDLWLVHAGAIADDDGRVVLFSGRSGMGKTTLMSSLARDYAYVSDESVGVAPDGSVLPYRKPLSIVDGAGRAKKQVSPRGLGLRDLPPTPLRLHAVVVLDRQPRSTQAALEPLDIADAVAAIAPQCSYLADLPRPLETLIGHVSAVGGALRLRYAEAADVLPLIRDLFAAPRPASREPIVSQRAEATRGASGFTRTPVVDAVALSGARLALLRRAPDDETTIHLVDGIGPVLWRAADGASFDDLVAAAVHAHGEPRGGDAGDAVRAALTALCDAGLIAERP
ncbi:hypothetical protein AB0O16_11550 [Microbacterium sp. NPDC089180]|uniref:ATP-binding protein n=1 Tax=unclassified Microbacterium TaxID=2609290 RepID=UPI00343F0CD8